MIRTQCKPALTTAEGAEMVDSTVLRSELLADYPDLLTVGHVCELTGLSAQTVRKEINEGRLPGFHIGRRLFMSKQGFLDYIKEGGGAHVPHVAAR